MNNFESEPRPLSAIQVEQAFTRHYTPPATETEQWLTPTQIADFAAEHPNLHSMSGFSERLLLPLRRRNLRHEVPNILPHLVKREIFEEQTMRVAKPLACSAVAQEVVYRFKLPDTTTEQ